MKEPTIKELCKPLSATVTPDRCKLDSYGNPITYDESSRARRAKNMAKRIADIKRRAGKNA